MEAVRARRQLPLLRWVDWRFCFLLAGSTLGTRSSPSALARAGEDHARRARMAVGVACNLALLGSSSTTGSSPTRCSPPCNPWARARRTAVRDRPSRGISFFTFRALSYVDRRRTAASAEPVALLDFAVYLVLLPPPGRGTHRAGLRVRAPAAPRRTRHGRRDAPAADLPRAVQEGRHRRRPGHRDRRSGVRWRPSAHTDSELLVGAWAYAVQIYADFSGYTDIALGIAAAARHRVPGELRLALLRRVDPGVLAALAHDPVALAARLPVHPARRQPGGPRRSTATCSSRCCSAGCGTARAGTSWSGAPSTAVAWRRSDGTPCASPDPPTWTWARPVSCRRTSAMLRRGGPAGPSGWACPVSTAGRQRLAGARRGGCADPVPSRRRHARDAPARACRAPDDEPWLARLWVFHFVVVGWIFFRAPDLGVAISYLVSLLTNWGSARSSPGPCCWRSRSGWSASSSRAGLATRSSSGVQAPTDGARGRHRRVARRRSTCSAPRASHRSSTSSSDR